MAHTMDLAARIAAESASLSPVKQSAVLDFVLFVKEREDHSAVQSDGDAAWERIINRPDPSPKLEAYMREAAEEGEEPLDLSRL